MPMTSSSTALPRPTPPPLILAALSPQRIETQPYISPCGELILGAFAGQLCLCDWRWRAQRQRIDTRLCTHLQTQLSDPDAAPISDANQAVLAATQAQLDAFFAGQLRAFSLPLLLLGTPFQKAVWQALMAIPYGQTRSYQALADALGRPQAMRAVANANGANALSIIIPCHRIIGKDGTLVGYAGGLTAKRTLLALEQGASKL